MNLYAGLVRHARVKPRRHRLAYRVFMLLLDLDDLDKGPWLFSHNRFNLISVHDKDHGDGSGAPLKVQAENALAGAGLAALGGPIRMLCMPRILGRGFNPLTVYFCHRRDGTLGAVIYEVRNTFGGRHSYVLPAAGVDGPVGQGCAKAFFVSPFMDMGLRYGFEISPPDETVSVGVRAYDGEGLVLAASFAGKRRPATGASLLGAWLTHPLQTIGVLAAIYWEAVKLFIKGFSFRLPSQLEQSRSQTGQIVSKPQ